MTWVRLDDASAPHPKFVKAGVAAYGLWCAGLAYCNRYLTDGIIPKEALEILLPGTPEKVLQDLARRLCSNRVRPDGHPSWEDNGDEYRVHDFEHYQPTKEEVEAERHASRHRQKVSRSRRRHAVTPGVTDSDVAPPVTVVSQSPVPSRPIPSHPMGALHPRSACEDSWMGEARDRILAVYPAEHTGGEVDAERVIFEMARLGTLVPDGEPVRHRHGTTVASFCRAVEAWKGSDPWQRGKVHSLRNFAEKGVYLTPPPVAKPKDERRAAGGHEDPQPSLVRRLA